jgi:hypothetical protein
MSIGDQFVGLPMAELIGVPLAAASDAQLKLAIAQYGFIQSIAFEPGKPGEPKKTKLLEFNLQRPVADKEGKITTVNTKVQAPFLGMVPVPSLLIEDVNIEFQMEVSATEKAEEKSESELNTEATAGFDFWRIKSSVTVKGKVSSSRETTRQTNQTAKYQVRVVARQQHQTEGLSRLMDIMAECVTPLSASASGDKK